MPNLIRTISEETPGLTLRVALRRWLARRSGGLDLLAQALDMKPEDVQSWLNNDNKRLLVAATYTILDKLPAPEKKKPGPTVTRLDEDQRRRIKTIGAHEYARQLLEERKESMG